MESRDSGHPLIFNRGRWSLKGVACRCGGKMIVRASDISVARRCRPFYDSMAVAFAWLNVIFAGGKRTPNTLDPALGRM